MVRIRVGLRTGCPNRILSTGKGGTGDARTATDGCHGKNAYGNPILYTQPNKYSVIHVTFKDGGRKH